MSSSIQSPFLLNLSKWQRSERVFHDSKPSPVVLIEEYTEPKKDDKSQNSSTINNQQPKEKNRPLQAIVCAVCQQHTSRYHCPRCQMAYCSVACYQTHTTTTTNEQSGEGGSSHGSLSACTEAFYRDRVTSMLHLEAKEQEEETRNMLHRQFHSNHDLDDDDDQQEELYEVYMALEQYEREGNTDYSEQTLKSLLSPSLKAAFDRALMSQTTLQKLVLEPWFPWWRPQLVDNHNHTDDEDIQETMMTTQLLDERLLKIPPFSSLRKGPSPQLAYNLLDILYSIAWTLRLYHGLHNATSHAPVEAVETLLSSSHVLSQDARYTTLEEVLGASTTLSTQLFHHSSGGCNTHWTVLTQDVAFLAQSNRHFARALLEAIDILRSAISQFQKQQHQKQKQQSLTNDEVMEQKTTVVRWKQSKKKLEFYLSWSWEHADLYELGERIYSWMETWRYENQNDEKDDLLLPSIDHPLRR